MKKLFDGFVESIPLTFFVIYIHCFEMSDRQSWFIPYAVAFIASVIVTSYLIHIGSVLNRICLGISAYFLTGFFGLAVGWNGLNDLYGELRALGMLAWIFAIGMVTLCWSRFGFIGIESVRRSTVRFWSLLLLLVCAASIAMAASFPDNLALAEWIPFLLIFFTRAWFQRLSQR